MDAEFTESGRQSNQWAMLLHLSQLTNYLLPPAGIIIPILIWQLKKDQHPELEAHGKMVVNWMISVLIYAAVSFVLTFVVIGVFLFAALAVVSIIFPIIGAVKANSGQLWTYPLTLNLIK